MSANRETVKSIIYIHIIGYNTEWVKKNEVNLHVQTQNEPHDTSLSELNMSQSNYKKGSVNLAHENS